MLYIWDLSHKFDLNQTTRVLHWNLDRGHGHVHIQHDLDHTIGCQYQHAQRENRLDDWSGASTWATLALPGRKIRANKQTTGRPLRIKCLVFLQSDWCNWKEIPIHGTQSRKHDQIHSASQLAPGALPHDVLDGIITHLLNVTTKKNLVLFIKFASHLFQIEVSHLYTPATMNLCSFFTCRWSPMPTYYSYMNSCLYQSTNPLLFCCKHFNHPWCRSNKSSRHWTLSILSNNFQFQTTSLLPPWRLFLLQREEGDGNQFEKILFRSTVYESHSIQNNCHLKIAEAHKNIFKLSENTSFMLIIPTE